MKSVGRMKHLLTATTSFQPPNSAFIVHLMSDPPLSLSSTSHIVQSYHPFISAIYSQQTKYCSFKFAPVIKLYIPVQSDLTLCPSLLSGRQPGSCFFSFVKKCNYKHKFVNFNTISVRGLNDETAVHDMFAFRWNLSRTYYFSLFSLSFPPNICIPTLSRLSPRSPSVPCYQVHVTLISCRNLVCVR